MTRPGETPYAGRGRRRPRLLRWAFLALLIVPIIEIAAIVIVVGGLSSGALLAHHLAAQRPN